MPRVAPREEHQPVTKPKGGRSTAAFRKLRAALQNGWQRRQHAKANISKLRELLVEAVKQQQRLTYEDFFLLFSYSVYTALCDTCFLFYDCRSYEDGEKYLVPDPSTKCTDPAYLQARPYVVVMSVLFPLGIPLYYMLILYQAKAALNPSIQNIFKDKVSPHAHSF